MSTKTKTKQTIDYNKPALGVYNALQPQIQAGLQQYLQGDLLNSPFFQQALAFMLPQASQLGQRGIQNIFSNFRASGMSGMGMPGFQASALSRAGRATSSLQSNAFWQAYSGANQARMSALGQAQGYQPLQMGSTQIQKTSGLGTWLPQVAGMVGGALLAPFTGGLSLMGTLGGALGSRGMPGVPARGSYQPSPLNLPTTLSPSPSQFPTGWTWGGGG